MTRNTPTPAIPLDADGADVVDQHQPVTSDDDDIDLPDEIPLDADPADVIDQHLTVPVEDDDWRT